MSSNVVNVLKNDGSIETFKGRNLCDMEIRTFPASNILVVADERGRTAKVFAPGAWLESWVSTEDGMIAPSALALSEGGDGSGAERL